MKLVQNISQKISKEFTKESLNDRIDPRTTHPFWRKVRNIAGSIASGGGIVMAVMPAGKAKLIVGIITGIATAISTGSHLNKSLKK